MSFSNCLWAYNVSNLIVKFIVKFDNKTLIVKTFSFFFSSFYSKNNTLEHPDIKFLDQQSFQENYSTDRSFPLNSKNILYIFFFFFLFADKFDRKWMNGNWGIGRVSCAILIMNCPGGMFLFTGRNRCFLIVPRWRPSSIHYYSLNQSNGGDSFLLSLTRGWYFPPPDFFL